MRAKLLFILIVLFQLGCTESEVEVPEYAKHDWYAFYDIDEKENIIVKDGDESLIEPYLSSYQSYSYILHPDSTEEVLALHLHTYIQSRSEVTDSVMFYDYEIVTKDEELINLKGKPLDDKLNSFKKYFENRRFLNTPEHRIDKEYVYIRLQNLNGTYFFNQVFSNGSYTSILDYEIYVLKAEIYDHPEMGKVIKVKMSFKAEVESSSNNMYYPVFGETLTFFEVPFE